MGISAGGSKGGPKSDINVTPLVDVVLVLLIIFIVTMPVLMRHITIEVPRELEADEIAAPVSTQVTITGQVDGTVEVDDGATKQNVQRGALAKSLRELFKDQRSEKVVFVDFEDGLSWDQVMSLMDTVRGVGTDADPVKVALKIRDDKAATGAGAMPAR